MSYHAPDNGYVQELSNIANRIRINSVKATCESKSGHPTSAASCAEALAVLFFHTMKYHPEQPRNPSDDRFVMSKGHACPGLYAAWVETGHVSEEELMKLRKIDSDIEGHPTPRLDFIDVATGSLGQGLSMSAGMAYVGKYLENAKYRVFCLLGDGEMAEGSVWEALAFSSHYKLDNLVAIIDVNRLGQSEPTMLGHEMETYRKRIDAFGWNAIVVDGHSITGLCRAFYEAEHCTGKPTCLIMKSFKGKNILGQEDKENFHGKPVTPADKDKVLNHIETLLTKSSIKLKPKLPEVEVPMPDSSPIKLSSPPNYTLGDKVATRAAYGTALVKVGRSSNRVISLDGDTKNSTFALDFKKAFDGSNRFIECFIAEQNLVGVAIGAETRRRTVPFCSTFAAFFTRAFDQIRMGAVSQTNVNFVGSHAGISIGPDGPSQMALEDLAMFRAIPGATVFYPSDAVSCERAIELAANKSGICFVRTGRPANPVIYENNEPFEIGRAKVVVKGKSDKVTVVGCGVTLHEAMAAAKSLKGEGIEIRVVDPFTLKPLDKETVMECAQATGGRIITVEDHYPEGGLGGAVAEALSNVGGIFHQRLAVGGIARSGSGTELMSMFKIDAAAICNKVKEMLS